MAVSDLIGRLRAFLAASARAATRAPSALNEMARHRPAVLVKTAIAGAALAAVAAGGAVWAWIYVGLPQLPEKESIWAYNRAPGVTFLDRNGEIIGVRGPSYGRRVALADLPEYVPEAFMAIEDRRFYEHSGVDNMAILRAAMANMTAGRTVQGGSTISQQLAKNLFLTPDQTIRRKLQEMVLAARLEDKLDKKELLELYLNRVFLGENSFGVDAAARRYFGTPAADLTIAQAAMLAGLPKAPSRTAPTSNFERARERQLVVLEAMVEAGFISAEQKAAAVAEPVEIVDQGGGEGALGYIFDMAQEEASRLIGDRAPDLVIQLTIDPALQDLAEASVTNSIGRFAENETHPLQAAVVATDTTGAVRALVGGMNYGRSKFNRAVQARRQPGSAFKTFVYAAALERNMHPDDIRYDEPIAIRGWRPTNYDDGYRGAVTLRTAFALSLNTVAAEVGHETGLRNVVDLSRRFGVTLGDNPAEFDDDAIPLSITLGAVETSVWDMTQGISVFMNGGRLARQHIIQAITDSRGVRLFEQPNAPPQQVFAPQLNEQMTSMMGAVVRRGTGTRAQIQGRDVAGKSGTSQNWRDAWFVGFTAQYTVGVWVGLDDFTSMRQVRGLGRVTGGSLPADIFHDFMVPALRDQEALPLAGIDEPERSPRDRERASFYDALREALGSAPAPAPIAAAPPLEYFQ